MCTVGAIRISGPVLFKNRDKLKYEKECVEVRNNCIVIRGATSKNIMCGLNKYGVAFVRTEIPTPDQVKSAYANLPIKKDGTWLHPGNVIGAKFSAIKNAKEIIELITGINLAPSNLIVADAKNIFSVELNGYELTAKTAGQNVCRTNHLDTANHGAKKYTEYPSSFERRTLAEKEVPNIKNIRQLMVCLAKHNNTNLDFSLCRHGPSKTISSTIIDCANRVLWHTSGAPCKSKYVKINMGQ